MLLPIAYEGEGRDGYRDQIVTCDVGVSLNSKTHPLFMKYSNGTGTQCYAYHYPSLFPVLFLQSLQRIFHLLVILYVPRPLPAIPLAHFLRLLIRTRYGIIPMYNAS